MFKAGTSGQNGLWRGVIRNARGQVVWKCPHCHRNRDQSTASNYSARDCAEAHLNAATDDTFGAWLDEVSFNHQPHPSTVRRIREQQQRAPEIRAALGL